MQTCAAAKAAAIVKFSCDQQRITGGAACRRLGQTLALFRYLHRRVN
jgi:hypothetical protein